jgi:cold shock CspA family protein
LIEGTLRRLDRAKGTAVVETPDGKEVPVHFHPESYIAIPDPVTMGNMTGSVDDLKEGYWVQAEVVEGEGGCHCTSLTCLS